jgi:class 3 adenylate cyclase
MSLKDELNDRVDEFVKSQWGDIPTGRVVPTPDSLTFGNTGIYIEACVLYADIHKSTAMVREVSKTRAAEYYKAFLHCAAKLIKSNDGTIVAYDGDRVMAIYMGEKKADHAIKTAFNLYWVIHHIINPKFNALYTKQYELKHTVGIDTGQLLASKTGVRVDSDIVWVGNAANHASKLNSFDGLNIEYRTRITKAVWDEASYVWCFGNEKEAYWTQLEERDGISYRSSKWWTALP